MQRTVIGMRGKVPVSEAELEAVLARLARGGTRLADLLIVLAWTGRGGRRLAPCGWPTSLRSRCRAGWSAGHKSEGEAVTSTRAGPRAGPLANRVRPMVRDMRVRKVR
ncbi:hypothetical protein ASD90_20110 [Terrabacter sp. Root181]|nr:hypothetical protein ASD90_20110 [Terrabacter sp. Root181]